MGILHNNSTSISNAISLFYRNTNKSKQLEIAKKMKEEKFDRETIKRITNLTAEEIEKL